MGASTEMTRLDSLPKETLDALMELVEIGAAEKLNNMESGIVGAGSIFMLNSIRVDAQTTRLSMKMGDIIALVQNGKVPLLVLVDISDDGTEYGFGPCALTGFNGDGSGYISFTVNNSDIEFVADSGDEYPTAEDT